MHMSKRSSAVIARHEVGASRPAMTGASRRFVRDSSQSDGGCNIPETVRASRSLTRAEGSFYTGRRLSELFDMTIAIVVVDRWRMDR
jgi:hypothetical protein